MRLLAHLLAADVRKFRLTMAIWLAVVVADAVLNVVNPLVAEWPRSVRALTIAAALLWLARVPLFIALVPLIVQTHPLVGSDAFWMTRPIPPRTLLLSKAILLSLLLVIAPLVCDVGVMAVYRVPPGQMVLVALQSSLVRLIIVVLLMAGAAVTPSLARFAVLLGSVLLSLAVLASIAASIAMSDLGDESSYLIVGVSAESIAPFGDQTSALVASLLLVVAGFVFLAVQYRTRSLRRSIPVGLAAVVLTGIIESYWPWHLIERPLVVPDWARSPSALQLQADPASVILEANTPWSGRPAAWRTVRAQAWVTGVAPDWLPRVRLRRAVWDLAPATQLASPGHRYATSLPVDRKDAEPPLHRVLQNVLGVRRIIGPTVTPRAETAVVFLIREEDRVRYESANGMYRGEFVVDLTQAAVAATLPLARGSTFQDGAHRVRIEEVTGSNSGVTLRARTSRVATMFDRRPRPEYSFYLRNQRLGEAASGLVGFFQDGVFSPLMFFGIGGVTTSLGWTGFAVGVDVIRFPETYGSPEESVRLGAAWLSGAELVIVRTEIGGEVPRILEMPEFHLRRPIGETGK